ncbi:receptor-type tyrosine-protein phosphatase F-like [Amphiura filiformis]|uniref:receptor-type tyrosine-protein phosphatase F-like n=1 Tax=Amphiura filiformis TaxID=82378 RepID=UPI003B211954
MGLRGYICGRHRVISVLVCLSAIIAAHGQDQDTTLPEIVCTIKPALLPSDLPFSSPDILDTTQISQTEIRAYVNNPVVSSTDNITFTRAHYTGNEHTIPEGSVIQRTDYGARILMPNYKNTSGIYTCELESGAGVLSTSVVLHTRDADPRPAKPTVTASIGETTMIRVIRNNLMGVRWKRTENDKNIKEGKNNDRINIDGVTLYNGTTYEAYQIYERTEPHAIVRLIVRECPAGYWGPSEDCAKECPMCFNGGVCNDKTGHCICAPGFSGTNCQNLHGRNRFGQQAQYNCSNGEPGSSPGCQGVMFCLQDPYGCSCAAGYRGLDCMSECREGDFGADCLQECHCMANQLCAKDTGRCQHEQCAIGYTGNNCQEKIKVSIDASTAVGYNTGQVVPIRCSSFVSSLASDISLLLPNGTVIPPSRTAVMSTVHNGLDAEFLVVLEKSSQEFTCIGETSADYGNSTAAVEAFVPPQLPNPPEVTLSQSTSIMVTWQPWQEGIDIGDGPVTSYLVQYRKANTNEPFTTFFTGSASTSSVGIPLEPETSYEVVVVAVRPGVGGEGPPSPVATAATSCLPPTARPEVISTERKYKAFTINWQLPSEDTWGCSEITTRIRYQGTSADVPSSGHVDVPLQTNGGVQSFTVDGLVGCTEYTIQLMLSNSGGFGPRSSMITVDVGGEAPGPVGNITLDIRSTRIKLKYWDPPETGCDFQYYNITHQLINFDQCNQTTESKVHWRKKSASRRRLSLGSNTDKEVILPYSTYNISITATSLDGEGESYYFQVVTDSTYPSAPPTNITVSSFEPEKLVFTWEHVACGSRHGYINNFTSKLTDEDGGRLVTRYVGAYVREVSYINLNSCTNYTFEIRANVMDRSSQYSNPLWVTTPVGLPDIVSDLRAFAPREDTIYVSWDKPNNTRCDLQYHIEYSLSYSDRCLRRHGATIMYAAKTSHTNYLLQGLEPFSTYTIYVTASSQEGNGTRIATVAETKETAPGPVINIWVTNTTSSSITFEWEEPPCGQRRGLIMGYYYQLRHENNTIIREGSASEYDTEVTFYDLQGCTGYTFQVLAWTHSGNGTYERSRIGVTGVSVPAPISELYVEPHGPTAFHISWLQPVSEPCPISNYVIMYSLLNRDQCEVIEPGTEVRDVFTTDVVHVLRNLEPHSTYSISVVAETESGVGDAVTIHRNTTSDVPGRIQDVLLADRTNNSLTFTWEPPPCGEKGGPITSYIYLVLTADGEEMAEEVVTSTYVTLMNLKPCSTYEILVKARNDHDNVNGMYSQKSNGTTAVAKPGKVNNVHIVVGITSAKITWSPPSNFTCDITTYSVFFGLRNPGKCGKIDMDFVKAGDTRETEYNLEGLLPFSVYRVYIVAASSAGLGESKLEPFTTRTGVPEKPQKVSLNENLAGVLSFSWNLLLCTEFNGNLEGYNYLLLRNGRVIADQNVTATVDTVSIEKKIITPCTEYVFKVRAFSREGFGEFSETVKGTTVPSVPPAVENVVIYEIIDDPTQLAVVWDRPMTETCEIKDFLIMYGIVSLDNCQDEGEEFLMSTMSIILTNGTDIILDELHPNTLYNVTITARTAAGEGDNVSVIYRTPEAAPISPPRVYTEAPFRDGTLFFTWEPLPCDEQNGIITGYNVTLSGENYYMSEIAGPNESYKRFDNLKPCVEYKFRMNAINGAGAGPFSVPVAAYTLSLPPKKVATITAKSITRSPNALNITWTMPTNQICPIDNFTITTRLIRRLQCVSVNELREERVVVAGIENSFVQMDLFPASIYNVTIFAATEAGRGRARAIAASTSESVPSGPPNNVMLRRQYQRELTFTWDIPTCSQRNGEIVGYRYTLHDNINRTVDERYTIGKEVTITGLIPFTSYEFRVRAATREGYGPYSVVTKGKTMEGVPPMPVKLDAIAKTNTSLHLQWTRPDPTHGVIIGYRLSYWPTDGNGLENVTQAIRGPFGPFPVQQRVLNLHPYTRYSIQVQAKTRVGYGAWTHPYIIARTDEGIPTAPVEIFVDQRSQRRLHVGWKEPNEVNGRILQYNIKYKAIEKPFDSSFVSSDDKLIAVKSKHKILDHLDPATKYEISVLAATSAGNGPSVTITEYTKPPTPRAPKKPFRMPSKSDLEVHLHLVPVDGDFSVYDVSVKRTPNSPVYRRAASVPGSFLENSNDYIAAEFTKTNLPGNFTVGDNKTHGGYYNAPLVPDYEYSISLCAVSRTTKDTESSCSDPVEVSPQSNKVQSPPSPLPFDIIGIAAAILFALIIAFLIFAVIRKRRVSRSEKITDEVGMSNITVHATYVKVKTDLEKPQTNGIERNSPIKRSTGAIRNKPRLTSKPVSPSKGWRPPTPISIHNLTKYMKQRKADGDTGFHRDYESMPGGQTYPWDIAKIPENKPKNRYANIIAYDHSRVILEPYDDVPYSDYINANYVDGYRSQNKYIASQGPNQASTVDFWRMMWQERVPKVIMLTNIVENGKKKCEKYWPKGVQRYGELLVNMTEEKVNEYYTERTFYMEDDYIGEQRQVKQFHFTAWPDMGLPESPTPLISFVQKTKEYHIEAMQDGPTVVHCSAGVGRTGTFLAIDAMLDMAVIDKKVNVLDYVYRMRQRRIKMVQTQDQYMFIYEVLLEALLCGDTVFPSNQFSDRYSYLKQPNPFTDKPYIEEQLRALDVMSVMPNEDNARGGRMPDNMEKNRYQHLIPIDKYRPYLMTQWQGETNYINATFLDAYRKKDGFLATQMPLPTTLLDFWRMIYDYRSDVIVMLNRMDLEDSSCAQYWPDSGSVEYGPFHIELMSAEECGETIVRTLKLKHPQNKDSRIIHQYQYLGWPERETFPASPSSLLALTELVESGRRSGGDGPTTVHCMDGVSRCGLVCAILMALSKLKQESNVDVFHAVKKLRKARAGMVSSQEHYVYCYNTMLTYLESNQVYENYK